MSTRERQQLGIGGEDLGNGVLKLASLLHQSTNLLHPFIGDTLDALAAIHPEGQRPNGMSFSIDTVTVGFPAAPVRQCEEARHLVWSNLQSTKPSVLALA